MKIWTEIEDKEGQKAGMGLDLGDDAPREDVERAIRGHFEAAAASAIRARFEGFPVAPAVKVTL